MALEPHDCKQEITVKTAVGSLAAKGFRVSDTIGLMTLLVVVALGAIMFQHMQQTAEANQNIATAINKLTASTIDNTRQQKKQTCLFSMPIERREQEYSLPYSQCNQAAQ